MEGQNSSLVSVSPFYVDRKYRPPAHQHSRVCSTVLFSSRQHQYQISTDRSSEMMENIKSYRSRQASEVRDNLNKIKSKLKFQTSEQIKQKREAIQDLRKNIKMQIEKAFQTLLEKNKKIYQKFRHICSNPHKRNRYFSQAQISEKKITIENIKNILESLTKKIVRSQLCKHGKNNQLNQNILLKTLQSIFKREDERNPRCSAVQIDVDSDDEMNSKKRDIDEIIQKINTIDKTNSGLTSKSSFNQTMKNILKSSNDMNMDYFQKSSEKSRKQIKKKQKKEFNNWNKKPQASKLIQKNSRCPELKFIKRKNIKQIKNHVQFLENVKMKEKNDSIKKKKKKPDRVIPEKESPKLSKLKQLISLNEEEVEDDLEESLKFIDLKRSQSKKVKGKATFSKNSYFKDLQKMVKGKDSKFALNYFDKQYEYSGNGRSRKHSLTKYEQQRLLYELIRHKKPDLIKKGKIRKVKNIEDDIEDLLSETEKSQLKQGIDEIDQPDYIKEDAIQDLEQKQSQKSKGPFMKRGALLRRSSLHFSEHGFIQAIEDKSRLSEIKKGKLWDDLLSKIMKRRPSYNLFDLKGNIEKELKVCQNPKAKQFHNFNNFLHLKLTTKLRHLQESWLNANCDDNQEIDLVLEKINIHVEDFEEPDFLLLGEKKTINMEGGKMNKIEQILQKIGDIQLQQSDHDLAQIGMQISF